ncbi:MAG TPA: hypothetical protein VKB75_09875 [Jatrophihabitans sp.]|nr:hypothetical protein [Jatrophihabitans sp.]
MLDEDALLDEELGTQTIELLPARETLWSVNVTNIIAVNIALAINAASFNASASALAQQHLAAFHR